MDSEFPQLAVIEIPECGPRLSAFAPSAKPRRQSYPENGPAALGTYEMRDRRVEARGFVHHAHHAPSLQSASHYLLPTYDATILDTLVKFDDDVKNESTEHEEGAKWWARVSSTSER